MTTTTEKAREQMRRALSHWHQSSCYPQAMEVELDIGLDAILSLTASPAQGEWISVPREQMARLAYCAQEEISYENNVAHVEYWFDPAKCEADGEVCMAPEYLRIVDAVLSVLPATPVAPSSGEWVERGEVLRQIEGVGQDWAYIRKPFPSSPPEEWQAGSPYDRGKQDAATTIAKAIRELPSTPKPQELAGER